MEFELKMKAKKLAKNICFSFLALLLFLAGAEIFLDLAGLVFAHRREALLKKNSKTIVCPRNSVISGLIKTSR